MVVRYNMYPSAAINGNPGPDTSSGQAITLMQETAGGVLDPAAMMAELHETRKENGVMRMRSVQALPLEPGKPVKMQPGGYHIMLMDLKQPLEQGESFPITLTFEHAAPVTVQVPVMAPGAAGPMQHR